MLDLHIDESVLWQNYISYKLYDLNNIFKLYIYLWIFIDVYLFHKVITKVVALKTCIFIKIWKFFNRPWYIFFLRNTKLEIEFWSWDTKHKTKQFFNFQNNRALKFNFEVHFSFFALIWKTKKQIYLNNETSYHLPLRNYSKQVWNDQIALIIKHQIFVNKHLPVQTQRNKHKPVNKDAIAMTLT